MSFIPSDLYEEILKLNKSQTNCILQIVPCKTTLIQLEKDLYREIYREFYREILYRELYREIYKRERFVKIYDI